MRAPQLVRWPLKQPHTFEKMTPEQLKEFVLETISGEGVKKNESAWVLWNPIFNIIMNFIDKADRDGSAVAW